MSLVRIQNKGKVTIPTAIRSQLGLTDGDWIDVKLRASSIVLVPHSPTSDDYTPAQRRAIGIRLAKSDSDIQKGRVHGPFLTAEEMEASVEAAISDRQKTKKNARGPR